MLRPSNISKRQPPTPNVAKTASLLRSTPRKLLSRKQLIRTKRHGQKLLQRHDCVLAQLVVHQYRCVWLRDLVSKRHPKTKNTIIPSKSRQRDEMIYIPYIAELANKLPAHATRAGRRRDVGGDCDGAEIACFGSLVIRQSVSIVLDVGRDM